MIAKVKKVYLAVQEAFILALDHAVIVRIYS